MVSSIALPVGGLATATTAAGLRAASKDSGGLTGGEVACSIGEGFIAGGVGAGTGISTLAHESGHALISTLLYKNANPMIHITPFMGGSTNFDNSTLSGLGYALGPNVSTAIEAAAGVTVDAVTSAASFAIGYKIRKEHPVAGCTMMGYGAFMMASDTWYASSALHGSLAALASRGNDFAGVAQALRISPWVGFAVMASVLPLEYLALRHLEKKGRL